MLHHEELCPGDTEKERGCHREGGVSGLRGIRGSVWGTYVNEKPPYIPRSCAWPATGASVGVRPGRHTTLFCSLLPSPFRTPARQDAKRSVPAGDNLQERLSGAPRVVTCCYVGRSLLAIIPLPGYIFRFPGVGCCAWRGTGTPLRQLGLWWHLAISSGLVVFCLLGTSCLIIPGPVDLHEQE